MPKIEIEKLNTSSASIAKTEANVDSHYGKTSSVNNRCNGFDAVCSARRIASVIHYSDENEINLICAKVNHGLTGFVA